MLSAGPELAAEIQALVKTGRKFFAQPDRLKERTTAKCSDRGDTAILHCR